MRATAAAGAGHGLDPRPQGRAQTRTCSPPASAALCVTVDMLLRLARHDARQMSAPESLRS